MKKILLNILIGTSTLFYFSCDEKEEFQPSTTPHVFISGAPTQSVLEGCEPGEATFTVSTSNINSSGTIEFDLSGTAVYGTDFNVTGADVSNATADGFTLNLTSADGVSSGSFSFTYPDDNATDGTKEVIATMASANAGGSAVTLGNFAGEANVANLIIGDAAAVDYSGSYSVTTISNACGAEPITTVVTLTKLTGTTNVYRLSDVTFGAYPICYGASDNPADITITSEGVVSIVDQPDVVYGGDIFNGSGTAEPCGSFEVEWYNGYGDAGISNAVK